LSQTFCCTNTSHFQPRSYFIPTRIWRWNRQCSEVLALKLQTPVSNPEESIQHSENGKSLNSRLGLRCFQELWSWWDAHQIWGEHTPSPEEWVYYDGWQTQGESDMQEQAWRKTESISVYSTSMSFGATSMSFGGVFLNSLLLA
jgi:hypothetical protein